MPIILRNTPDWNCLSDVACSNVYTADFANKQINDVKALASAGQILAEGNNGMRRGCTVPFNGWALDEASEGQRATGTSGTYQRPLYETVQMAEVTRIYNRMSLQTCLTFVEGDSSGYMSEMEFVLVSGTTEYTMLRVVPSTIPVYNAVGIQTGYQYNTIPPGAFSAPIGVEKRFRAVFQPNPYFVAPHRHAVSFNVVTRVWYHVNRASAFTFQRRFLISGLNDWYRGIKFYQLKGFHECL